MAEETGAEPRLQFGTPDPGVDYVRRHAAFGVVEQDGRIACVRVERGPASYFDLPGGAVDGEESEPEALAREFVEETGLFIVVGERFGEAAQFFRRSNGAPVNNTGGFWTGRVERADPAAKVEEDHALDWLEPGYAIANLRHDAHAWAVAAWLRR